MWLLHSLVESSPLIYHVLSRHKVRFKGGFQRCVLLSPSPFPILRLWEVKCFRWLYGEHSARRSVSMGRSWGGCCGRAAGAAVPLPPSDIILKLSFRLQKFFFFALFTAAQLLTPCCGKGYRYSRFKAMQNIYLGQSLRVAYISGVSTSTILTNIQLGTSC